MCNFPEWLIYSKGILNNILLVWVVSPQTGLCWVSHLTFDFLHSILRVGDLAMVFYVYIRSTEVDNEVNTWHPPPAVRSLVPQKPRVTHPIQPTSLPPWVTVSQIFAYHFLTFISFATRHILLMMYCPVSCGFQLYVNAIMCIFTQLLKIQ